MTVQLDCLQIAKAAGLGQGKTSGKEILFHCSRHPDKHPSLSIHPGKNKWFCGPCGKGGGPWQLAAFLSGRNPFEKGKISAWLHEHGLLDGEDENKRPPSRKSIPPGIEAAVYSYRDENGKELFQVVRYQPKMFRQRRPDGKGGYTWKLEGVRRVLYRVPELISELKERPPGERTVYVAEGEKDVDALRERGLTATTNPGGAGKWRREYTDQLCEAGAECVAILGDNDDAGESHALEVARSCHAAGLRVTKLVLPGLPLKGDVSDYFNAGHSTAELEEIAHTTAQIDEGELKKAKDAARLGHPHSEQSRQVKDLLPQVKGFVPEGLVLPSGYWIYENQIYRGEQGEHGILTQTPVFIVVRKLKVDDNSTSFEVVIVDGEDVRTLEDDATLFFEQRKIVALRRRGIDTNSIQARALVEYFVAFERQNRIPQSFVTESFGLKRQNGRSAYVLGETCTGDLQNVSFQPASKSDRDLCQAFEPRGSLELWKEALQKVRRFDTVLFTIFFSLTPPLHGLEILPFENCTLHLCSPTSQGKSITQRIAISMMGNPESRRLLGQWQGTFTGTEEHITNFQGLPVFLEDSQQCKPEHRQEIIYGIGNGAFRHRSRVWKPNEPIAIYKGVLISSGEDTLEEESSATGMLARFIELEGSPFERFDSSTGALVDDVRSIIRSNYGHVYPRYVKHLMSLSDCQREELREQFEKRTRYYDALAQGKGILARRSPVFAASEIAGQLLAEILGFTDLDPVPSVTRIFARVRDEDNSDQAADARLQLLSWAQANDNFFIKRRDDEELPQTGKFRGEIFGVKGRVKDQHFIAIFPHKVSEILKKLGFRPRSVLIQWRAQGVIQVSGDRKGKANKFTYPVTIDGKQVRLIKIVALDSVEREESIERC